VRMRTDPSNLLLSLVFLGIFCCWCCRGQSVCQTLQCVGVGGNCRFNSSSPFLTQCNNGLFCNDTVCAPQVAGGQPCSLYNFYDPCAPGYSCNQTQGICAPPPPQISTLSPGQNCTPGVDSCAYSNANFGCPSSGVCPGNTTGETCNNGQQCVTGLFCNTTFTSLTGFCVPLIPNGGDCDLFQTGCASGRCVAVSQTDFKCIGMYSSPLGGPCSVGDDCAIDLGCYLAPDAIISTCVNASVNSYKLCTSDSDCIAPEVCTCSNIDGNSYCQIGDPSETSVDQNLDNCAAKYGCSTLDLTCIFSNCATELCADVATFPPYEFNSTIVAQLACLFGTELVEYLQSTIDFCTGTTSGSAISASGSTSGSAGSTSGSAGSTSGSAGSTSGSAGSGSGSGSGSGTTSDVGVHMLSWNLLCLVLLIYLM